MMWRNPPPQIVAMRDVLLATAAFTGPGYTADQVIYPDVIEESETPVWPLFCLFYDNAKQIRIMITAPADQLDEGLLQILATDLSNQLPSRYRGASGGLVIAVEPEISEVGVPSTGMLAAGYDLNACEITCRIGLSLGA